MNKYFYKNVPRHFINKFCAVRDPFDNLANLLVIADVVNYSEAAQVNGSEDDFDFAIFSGSYSRALIKKEGGYFSMAFPFQIINHGDRISLSCDYKRWEVDGLFVSIMRSAINDAKKGNISHDEFVLSISDTYDIDTAMSIEYFGTFLKLICDDHGYFRFDDDPDNENGDLHPRYHFDFFYKNGSSIKIGYNGEVDIECFYSFFDSARPKKYIAQD